MPQDAYYSPEIETMERNDLDALIDERVRYTVQYAAERSPFYKHWFYENNINPAEIRVHEDLEGKVLAGRMHFVGWDQRHGYAERILGDVPESVYLATGWKLKNVLGDLVDTPGMSLAGLLKSGPGGAVMMIFSSGICASGLPSVSLLRLFT